MAMMEKLKKPSGFISAERVKMLWKEFKLTSNLQKTDLQTSN